MSTDLRAELAEYGRRQRAERRPVDMAEIMAAVDAAPSSLDASIDNVVQSTEREADGPRGDASMFDSRWRVDESTAPSVRKRWLGALTAVAATILVVVGVVVVADRDSGDVVPSSASVTDPTPSPEEPGPPPSVVDASGYRWSRLPHDDAVFGGENDQRINSVTTAGPGLVAVGSAGSDNDRDAAVWTSVDGITWSRVPRNQAVFGGSNSQRMVSVVAGGPGLVAVGEDGAAYEGAGGRPGHIGGAATLEEREDSQAAGVAAVWNSVDGITWFRVRHDEAVFGGSDYQWMRSVAVGGPGLVAVGSVGSNDGEDAAVWTSVDGVAWSRVPHDEAVFGGQGYQGMNSVVAAGPGLVAVGDDLSGRGPTRTNDDRAAVWTSVDGITWSRVPHDEAVFGGQGYQGMYSVVAAGPGLVAVGYSQPGDDVLGGPASHAAVWTSVDGITWSRLPHDETIFGGTGHQGMHSVTAAAAGLVAVGRDGGGYGTRRNASLWASVDGITWSRLPHDETIFGGTAMISVTSTGAGLMAVGHDELGDGDVDAVVWAATLEK